MRTASVTDRERREMLTALLRGVSRSFYLTMRALLGPVRGPIGLAYLLARTADTIADTATLPPDERLARLLAFRAQVQGAEAAWTVPEAEDPAERRLFEAAPRVLALLDQTAEADRARIRSVVITLSEGMEMDLRTFPTVESGEIGALADRAALDRYIYLVAGLRRRVLDGDDYGPRSGAAALGRRSVRGGGSSLRQGATADQRASGHAPRPAKGAVLPARG